MRTQTNVKQSRVFKFINKSRFQSSFNQSVHDYSGVCSVRSVTTHTRTCSHAHKTTAHALARTHARKHWQKGMRTRIHTRAHTHLHELKRNMNQSRFLNQFIFINQRSRQPVRLSFKIINQTDTTLPPPVRDSLIQGGWGGRGHQVHATRGTPAYHNKK